MIEIGINPNTKIPSVAIRLTGYFGIDRDGVKLVDSDTIFEAKTVILAGVLPITAFDTLQTEQEKSGEIAVQANRDSKGRFGMGNTIGDKGKRGRPTKTPLADYLRELGDNKHYQIKGGERVAGIKLLAEKVLDKAVMGDMKAIEFFAERTEGKVTQGVKLSGALSHGVIPEKDLEKLKEIFPDVE